MKRLENIIKNNSDSVFVVHVKNKQEATDFAELMKELNAEVEMNFEDAPVDEWLLNTAEENNFDSCYRLKVNGFDISLAWNPSVEHWRMYVSDIIELRDDKFTFNEGDYNAADAKIEAKKILELLAEDEGLEQKYGNLAKDQIERKLLNLNK